MKSSLAPFAVVLVIAAGLAGCVSNTASPPGADAEADTDDGRAPSNTSRKELEDNRITYKPDAGQWTSSRFTANQLLGDKTQANLTINYDPADGAQPYWGIIFRATAQGEDQTISVWGAFPSEEGTMQISMQRTDPEQDVDLDFVTVLGTNEANATFRLGLTEGVEDRKGQANANESLQTQQLAQRPILDVAPDATGMGGGAGTVIVRNTADGSETYVLGNLDLSYDGSTQGLVDVEKTLQVNGSGSIPGAGVGGMVAAESGDVGTGSWAYDLAMPPFQAQEEGRDVDPDRISNLIPATVQDTLGIENPVAFVSQEVEEGQASLDFERTYTGVGRTTVVMWGWATLDPAEVYGWDWTTFEMAS